jgi:hypothetical protein
MAPRKGKTQQQEQVVLGPQVKEGENVFGVAHIFASFKYKANIISSTGVSDYSLMPNEQFFSYIMARTSHTL